MSRSELGCNDQLTDMALRVLGQVNHQSHDCGWQLFSADGARIREAWLDPAPESLVRIAAALHLLQRATSIVRALDPFHEGLLLIARA